MTSTAGQSGWTRDDDGDGRSHRQELGLATFVDRRIPLIGQEASFVHGDFVDHDGWAIADRPRIAHAVRLLDRAGGRALTVVHLHGRRDTPTSLYPKPVRHASYLLVSDPSAVRAFDAPAVPEVSDHRPLVLDV